MAKTKIRRYERDVLGLPDGLVFPVTNSQMNGLACNLRWAFSEIWGMRPKSSGGAIDLGSSWDLIMEEVYRWWEEEDSAWPAGGLDSCVWCPEGGACDVCGGSGAGTMARAMASWIEALERDPAPFTPEEVEIVEERLRRSFRGYVEQYQAKPLQHYRIVGTKVKLARAVLNSDGSPMIARLALIEAEPGLWVPAGSTKAILASAVGGSPQWVDMPVYQVGELDCLARDRSSGAGWAIDAKYTSAMSSYQERLLVDPQLPGYCWLASAHLDHFGLTSMAGMMYDLCHSRLHGDPFELQWKPPLVRDMKATAVERGIDPKGLKSEDLMAALGIEPGHGGFSTSKSKLGGVPSWRLREAVEREGLSLDDYREAVEHCETEVDPSLYLRPWQTYGEEAHRRYELELAGKARAVVDAYTRAAGPGPVAAKFPRVPVCALPGGRCSYRGPCAVGEVAWEHFDLDPSVTWSGEIESAPEDPKPSAADATTNTDKPKLQEFRAFFDEDLGF